MKPMDKVPQKIARLSDQYQSVMRELKQLGAHPSTFPCDRHIFELNKKAARLRAQLQGFRRNELN